MKFKLTVITGYFVCSFLAAPEANAQPTYWEKAEANYQQNYRDKIAADMIRKPGSSTIIIGGNPVYFPTKEEKAARAAYMRSAGERNLDAYKREQERIRSHELYLQSIANEKAMQKAAFIQRAVNQLSGSNVFSKTDCIVLAQDEFYKSYAQPSSYSADYITGSRYAMKLVNAPPETALDTFVNYVWKARLYPAFSTKNVQQLQQKFPASKKGLERLELHLLAYYFGASTPYASAGIGYTYPLCSFEIMNDSQKTQVLNRFEELEAMHPETALEMAANCRINFNVFYKYATSNLPLKNKTSAKRLEYLYKTLATVQSNRVLPKEGLSENAWKLLADKLLKGAATELKLIYPGFVEDLSAERWLEIAKASKLNVEYIAWAFRDNDTDYLKKLPNLTLALKKEFDKAEDGEGVITYKNSDRYVGGIKDGKPDGIGKYTTAAGEVYEGTFRNGKLNGNGKAIYKIRMSNEGIVMIDEDDVYEGEFKEGERSGKGTLTNDRRDQKYIGGWLHNKKSGYGEEYIGGKLAFKGEYKDGFEVAGTQIKKNGDSFTGNFVRGLYDGVGTLKMADGSSMTGKWEEGTIDGKAVYTKANGFVMKYSNSIRKEKSNGKAYSRVITQSELKYYNAAGREITKDEFEAAN